MSIVSMMKEAADQAPHEGRAGSRRRRRPQEAAAAPPPADASAAAAQGLTKYIPTEAVALYTAILPFLVPEDDPLANQDYTSRWWLAGMVALAAVLWGVGVYRREVLTKGGSFSWPKRRTAVVVLAFAAWVCAIPGSPLGSFDGYSPAVGAVIGIVAGAAISLFILWFGGPEAAPQPDDGT